MLFLKAGVAVGQIRLEQPFYFQKKFMSIIYLLDLFLYLFTLPWHLIVDFAIPPICEVPLGCALAFVVHYHKAIFFSALLFPRDIV